MADGLLFHQRFVHIAKKHGGKLAFIDRTSDKKITYSKALIAALMLSERFEKYGPGMTGLMIPTSAGCALSILGLLMSGRTPVMINYSTGAAENAEYAKGKCGLRTIVTSKALLEKINCRHVEGMVYIEDIMQSLTPWEKLRAALRSKLPASAILKSVHGGGMDENAVILFTSGSEKDPKAVQLTQRNIISNIEGFSPLLGLSERDSFLANLPFFHVFGLTVTLFAPLFHGMTVITYANPVDYKTVCNIVREERPTLMAATPSFYWGYLRKSEPGDFKSLRFAVSGADKCPEALREAFMKKHDMALYEGYGVTETSPVISVNTPDSNRPGSTGKALPNLTVRIEDLDTGGECSTGGVGKILVKGGLVMKGYFNDIEETSLRIRDGWYDTGDMGFLDEEGYLWHSGRLKRFVKIGGEMVSLLKVENELEKLLPEDTFCCIVDVPDALKGAKIVAAVTQAVDEKEILLKLSQRLPNIALPRRFIHLKELPRMGSGKIDFRGTARIVSEIMERQA